MRTSALVLACLFVGCAYAPVPPEEMASEILADLDSGQPGKADDRFERFAHDHAYREKLYPLLFEASRDRYAEGDAAGAAEVLGFMAPRWPEATAVREALLYSHFLERAQSTRAPDEELIALIDEAVSELREHGTPAPVWVDLIEAQWAIDRGRLPKARASLVRFLENWDGNPPSMLVYVEDVERYLRSH